jgi:lysine decarboxylase
MLSNNSDVCAVVITSPTYYGITSDIKRIHSLTKRLNERLIVDGAHGGNLLFLQNDFYKAAEFMVVSAHKTLPALTGGGILIINDEEIQKSQVLSALSLFSTSSPFILSWHRLIFLFSICKKRAKNVLKAL